MTHKESTMNAWIRQPLALLCAEGGLSKPAAIVLALIIDKATDTDPPQPVNMQRSELARKSGYTTRSVQRALAELVSRQLLEIKRTGRGSVYTLTGAVELLPPKKKDKQAQSRRTTRKATISGMPLDEYEALANRFLDSNDYSEYVCAKQAGENDPDYEL